MTQIREEVAYTKGRTIVRCKLVSRGKGKRTDYIIYPKPNIPIAVIEANDKTHAIGGCLQQGLSYAKTLNIPFVFCSNRDGFVFHDRTGTSNQRESTPDKETDKPSGSSELLNDPTPTETVLSPVQRMPRCKAVKIVTHLFWLHHRGEVC